MFKHIPLTNAKPDASKLIDVIMGRAPAEPPRLVEYLINDPVRKPIVEKIMGREWVPLGADRESQARYLDNFIALWHQMGYDFVRFEASLNFPRNMLSAQDTADGVEAQRGWVDEHQGVIGSWEDFEKYPWPKIEDMDFFMFEYISTHLPEGMGMITCHGGGIFEHLSQLFSLEGLGLALCMSPDLVEAVAQRVGALLEQFYAHLLSLDNVIALWQGDDMGFRTSTLVAPDHLRQYTLPWHKRFAEMTHAKGLPYFLHSCGQLADIMPDLIDDVKIDAKHSFENVIIPINEFQAKYGDRIGVLGGVDVDILSAGSPDDVRKEVLRLIDICAPRGRFAIGSGNSIPTYIPVDNYLAMVDEVMSRR